MPLHVDYCNADYAPSVLIYMHVNYTLSICSQSLFLMKKLRDQGLPVKHPYTVFRLLFDSWTFW